MSRTHINYLFSVQQITPLWYNECNWYNLLPQCEDVSTWTYLFYLLYTTIELSRYSGDIRVSAFVLVIKVEDFFIRIGSFLLLARIKKHTHLPFKTTRSCTVKLCCSMSLIFSDLNGAFLNQLLKLPWAVGRTKGSRYHKTVGKHFAFFL